MMETIKNQTYKNIVTIVHSDDPRDKYVTGDIIIKGTAYGPEYGNGTYNLYNNRLLKAIPSSGPDGWFHFIDDDDEYTSSDVIEKLVKSSLKNHVNVARVERWNSTIWPKHWGFQKSFQTECFFMHTQYRHRATWWGNKGGDHNYSKKLTKTIPINWIDDLVICKAQEGKGHGKKQDKGGERLDYSEALPPDRLISVLGLRRHMKGHKESWIKQGQLKKMKYKYAYELEKKGIIKITHPGIYKSAPSAMMHELLLV